MIDPKRILTVVAPVAVVAALLTGCSETVPSVAAPAPDPGSSAPAPSAGPDSDSDSDSDSGASAEDEVRSAFQAYNDSLRNRDFATTCADLTDDSAQKITTAVAAAGGPKGLSCEQAFSALYEDQQIAGELDSASKSITIGDIDVSGDTATINFSGPRVPHATAQAVRTGGKWRFESNI